MLLLLFQDPYATVLFDREGQVMGMKVADDGQMRFEEVQDLPPRYVISVLVFEDRYFLAHQGVNWWALCRALVQNIQAGHVVKKKCWTKVENGQTITVDGYEVIDGQQRLTTLYILWKCM